jgi:hypothetical protein
MSAATVTLNWVAPTTNTDGSPITGAITYNLYQGASATTLAKVQSGLTATTAVVTAGLTPGTNEFFSVTAVAEGAESAEIAAVSAAIPALVPNAPTDLTAVVTG